MIIRTSRTQPNRISLAHHLYTHTDTDTHQRVWRSTIIVELTRLYRSIPSPVFPFTATTTEPFKRNDGKFLVFALRDPRQSTAFHFDNKMLSGTKIPIFSHRHTHTENKMRSETPSRTTAMYTPIDMYFSIRKIFDNNADKHVQ